MFGFTSYPPTVFNGQSRHLGLHLRRAHFLLRAAAAARGRCGDDTKCDTFDNDQRKSPLCSGPTTQHFAHSAVVTKASLVFNFTQSATQGGSSSPVGIEISRSDSNGTQIKRCHPVSLPWQIWILLNFRPLIRFALYFDTHSHRAHMNKEYFIQNWISINH